MNIRRRNFFFNSNHPKPSLGSCEVPQTMWARSDKPFPRLSVTNKQLQTNKHPKGLS